MGRVNLEENFFARSDRYHALANRLGWHRWQAMGLLADLWHKSQSEEAVKCSVENLVDWLLLPDDQVEKITAALVRTKYLKPVKDEVGWFEIAGNSVQIESRLNYLSGRMKGAEATKKKFEEQRKAKAMAETGHQPRAETGHQPGLMQGHRAGQSNPMQGNPMQGNPIQTTTTPKSPQKDGPSHEQVQEVAEEYEILFSEACSHAERHSLGQTWSLHPKQAAWQLKENLQWIAYHPKAREETASPLQRIFFMKQVKASCQEFDAAVAANIRNMKKLNYSEDEIAEQIALAMPEFNFQRVRQFVVRQLSSMKGKASDSL